MKICILIPTYRRPDDLRQCLRALALQDRPADEVRVVLRESDSDTRFVLREFDTLLPIATTVVRVPGVVAAMNAGLDDIDADIIAITDDDAAPWPDWLRRIEAMFLARPQAVGVGGRDWVYRGGVLADGENHEVGILRWYGRIVGEHHLSVGGPRPVHVLKGVNCAYRADALRSVGFDRRMLGSGAQVHWELSLNFSLIRRGGELWFDPAIAVNHGLGKRFDEDQRYAFNALAARNAGHNETLALLEHFSALQRLAFLLWAMCVGTRMAPGLLQIPRLMLKGDRHAVKRWYATLCGRALAVRGTWMTDIPVYRSGPKPALE
jgi:glycosyltransferase involved in cell wall biosynthesis